MNGDDLPDLRFPPTGPQSRALVDRLAGHECPAITARRSRRAVALGLGSDDPIVWEAAVGANVRDADGNVYIDLTSGFGVALVGHRNPGVLRAVEAQLHTLVHAMGDAWPDVSRIRLLEQLAAMTPGDLNVAILGLSGADAVDAAIKTAVLATGRSGVLCFEGGYHGLSLGTVALQGYKDAFVEPFREIAHPRVRHLPWGCAMSDVAAALDGVGLVLAEPIQGRGGIRLPPDGWMADLARVARNNGALFALDEIQTGCGRVGRPFAAEVVPDLMMVGKALGGGFPLSACLGRPDIMNAWGSSGGEAIHTQTFLGHPIGCAAGLAVLELLRGGLLAQVTEVGQRLREAVHSLGLPVRGQGLMLGIELDEALATSRRLLQRGFLALPAGREAEVLALTPPACLSDAQISAFAIALGESL